MRSAPAKAQAFFHAQQHLPLAKVPPKLLRHHTWHSNMTRPTNQNRMLQETQHLVFQSSRSLRKANQKGQFETPAKDCHNCDLYYIVVQNSPCEGGGKPWPRKKRLLAACFCVALERVPSMYMTQGCLPRFGRCSPRSKTHHPVALFKMQKQRHQKQLAFLSKGNTRVFRRIPKSKSQDSQDPLRLVPLAMVGT